MDIVFLNSKIESRFHLSVTDSCEFWTLNRTTWFVMYGQ